MANRIKSISKYSGTAWGTETPIGADAANVDLATSYTTVTESKATSGATAEAAIGKIHTDTTNLKKAGHGNGTVTNYDSTSSETSKVLTTDCVVAASDDTATAWSKFNRFRRRVSNKFADYFLTSNLTTSSTGVTTSGNDTHVYTTKAINDYLANVVGYTSHTAPTAGTIASQLESLNNKTFIDAKYYTNIDTDDHFFGLLFKTTENVYFLGGVSRVWNSIAITSASSSYGGYRSGEIGIYFPTNFFQAPPIFAITAYASGGNIVNNISSVAADVARFYFSSTVSNTRTVGVRGIVYGSVFPENF